MNVESLSCEHILARALEAAGGPAWARVATLHLKGRVAVGGLSGPTAQWIDLPTARHGFLGREAEVHAGQVDHQRQ